MKRIPKCWTEVKNCPRYETSTLIRNNKQYVNCSICSFSNSKSECKIKKHDKTVIREKKVTVTFVYPIKKGKDELYYKDLAFDEIYNSDDVLDADTFLVEDYKQ